MCRNNKSADINKIKGNLPTAIASANPQWIQLMMNSSKMYKKKLI